MGLLSLSNLAICIKAGDSTQKSILFKLYKLMFVIELSMQTGDRSKSKAKTVSFQAYQVI